MSVFGQNAAAKTLPFANLGLLPTMESRVLVAEGLVGTRLGDTIVMKCRKPVGDGPAVATWNSRTIGGGAACWGEARGLEWHSAASTGRWVGQ